MTVVLLAGMAAEPEVLALIGAELGGTATQIEGFGLVSADRGPWPVLVPEAGSTVAGMRLDLSANTFARLDFLLRGFGLAPETGVDALTYVGHGQERATPLDPGVLAVLCSAGADILALFGQVTPDAVAARLTPILVRAASRLRAKDSPPASLRHATAPDDVMLTARRQPYAHFFAIEEYDVTWRRFDGQRSEVVTRAAFLSGDAVTVLPYDPVRDRVLLIEQFRAGPLARGDTQLWQIEAIAGRVDPFEAPETAARREAEEEAGLTLGDLIFVARYYPSPGAVSEYIYSYVALTDLPDGSAGVFGVAGEAEDIRGHLIPFAQFMDLVTRGEIENAPLILTALWLQRERPALRG